MAACADANVLRRRPRAGGISFAGAGPTAAGALVMAAALVVALAPSGRRSRPADLAPLPAIAQATTGAEIVARTKQHLVRYAQASALSRDQRDDVDAMVRDLTPTWAAAVAHFEADTAGPIPDHLAALAAFVTTTALDRLSAIVDERGLRAAAATLAPDGAGYGAGGGSFSSANR